MRLARGIGWSAAGAIAGRGIGLISAIAVARLLGKAGYGELGIIQSTIGVFGVFAGFGLGQTATRYVALLRNTDPERAGRILALSAGLALVTGGLASAALLVAAPWLAAHTLAAPRLAGLLRVGAFYLLFSALNGAQAGALSGFEAFKAIATRTLVAGIATLPMMVGGAYWAGVTGAVWGLVGGQALNCWLNQIVLRAETRRAGVPVTFRGALHELPVVWRFSVPSVLSGAMVGPANWACAAMLVNQPNGYAEMGVYNAASQWSMVLTFLPGIAGQVVLPVLAERLGAGDVTRCARTLACAIKGNLVVTLPIAIVVSSASPMLMRAYGAGFTQGWPTLTVMTATTALVAALSPAGPMIAASGRMWLGFTMNFGWAVILLSATALWVGHGALGLASARAVAYVAHACWTFGFLWVIIKRQGALMPNA